MSRFAVVVTVAAFRRPALVGKATRLRNEGPDTGGRLRLGLDFGDRDHALAVLWSMAGDIEVLERASLRSNLARRAEAVLTAHATKALALDQFSLHYGGESSKCLAAVADCVLVLRGQLSRR